MLPQSFSYVNQKGMPAYFRETLSKDTDTQIRFANEMMHEMTKPPEERDPDMQHTIQELKQAVKEISTAPPSQLSPQLQGMQRQMMRTRSHLEEIEQGRMPPEYIEDQRAQHDKMIECAFITCPPLRDLQHQINALLLNAGEERSFDLPAFSEVLHKHFGRKNEFNMIARYVVSETYMLCQLIVLHMCKPEIHKKLIPLLCQAALFEQPDHPKYCSCMLCNHIRDPAAMTGFYPEEIARARARRLASSSSK